MDNKEGKTTVSKTRATYGKTQEHSFDSTAPNDIGIQQQVIGLENISYAQGFTKETSEWEFSRIDIRIGVFVPHGMDSDVVLESIKKIVKELVAVETDALNSVDRLPVVNAEDLEILNACLGRSISVTYGLTMKAKNRDSEKVDVARSKYVSDGEDIIDAHRVVGDWIASIIEAEHHRVKG